MGAAHQSHVILVTGAPEFLNVISSGIYKRYVVFPENSFIIQNLEVRLLWLFVLPLEGTRADGHSVGKGSMNR